VTEVLITKIFIAFDVITTGSNTSTRQPFITLLKYCKIVLLLDGYTLPRWLLLTKKNYSWNRKGISPSNDKFYQGPTKITIFERRSVRPLIERFKKNFLYVISMITVAWGIVWPWLWFCYSD